MTDPDRAGASGGSPAPEIRREGPATNSPGPIGAVLIALARLYQGTLSPLLGRQCRFVPTCSEYFIQAVRARGVLLGCALGLWRVLRCHPLARGGYDPVEGPRGRG